MLLKKILLGVALFVLLAGLLPGCSNEMYELEIKEIGEGSVEVDPDKDVYGEGEKVKLKAKPEEGYKLQEWGGYISDEEGKENITAETITVVMDSDITVVAEFVEIIDGLSVNVKGEGSVTYPEIENPEEKEFTVGEEVEIKAEPEEGYEFVEWEGDISGEENPKEIIVGDVEEITAEFKTSTYEIEVSEEAIEGEGELVVENENDFPEEDFEHGETVKLKARPGDFHQFSHWKEDEGRPPHDEDELEITMEATSDLTLAGVFEEIPYKFERESGTIVEFDGEEQEIEIPGEINGIDVTEIGKEAFKETKLEQVVLPDTLEVINSEAFADNELGTVVIPDSVERIGENAFKNNELQSFDLPLNADVKESAFDEDLTDIFEEYSDEDYVRYQQDDGYYLFNKDEAMVTGFEMEDNYDKELSIPVKIGGKDVKYIEDGSFEEAVFDRLELKEVHIPEGVVDTGGYTFVRNNLESLKIQDGVEKIGNGAFRDNNIDQLEIPDSVTEIGKFAFEENNIEQLKIPDSVSKISTSAFGGNNIDQLEIPNSVTKTGKFAFKDNNIEQLEISDSVTEISNSAFSGNNIEQLEIPKSVTEIGKFAFKDNNIKQLDIPDSVTKIGYAAFIENELSTVTIGAAVELEIQDTSFIAYEGCGPFSEDGSFKEIYEANDREAGEYVKEDGEWKKAEE
ncbi:MAG: leucine-rich repeat protein [Halanaerobiales bacterium]